MLVIKRNIGKKAFIGEGAQRITVETHDTGPNWADFRVTYKGRQPSGHPDSGIVRLMFGRHERYRLAENVTLYLVDISPRGARIGIDAPREINIRRDDVKAGRAAA